MSDLTPQTSAITFREVPARDEVIRIDAEGFHYLGQFIADAGEAYQLLVEFLRKHQQAPQPVSVHERLPGPEDCDELGRCWAGTHAAVDTSGDRDIDLPPSWELREVCAQDDHWLPAHALPLPEVSNG